MAVIDTTIVGETIESGRRQFARDLRVHLWLEHLGLSLADAHLVLNPADGVREWRTRAGTAPALAVVHTRPAGSENRIRWDTAIDPNGLC